MEIQYFAGECLEYKRVEPSSLSQNKESLLVTVYNGRGCPSKNLANNRVSRPRDPSLARLAFKGQCQEALKDAMKTSGAANFRFQPLLPAACLTGNSYLTTTTTTTVSVMFIVFYYNQLFAAKL